MNPRTIDVDVGRGVVVSWDDGHTTGIYTWEALREWCPCEECQAA